MKRSPLRRITLTVAGTVSAVVLMLSLKPHTEAGAHDAKAPPKTPAAVAGGKARTVTGATADTKYGPVQVRITVSGSGRITRATAPKSPDGAPRSKEINATAVPRLNHETVGRHTADVDAVSGATYTSAGYRKSLQSALDKAGL
ncbi:MAG: FMN-binding protein [Kitasatospora sp.]|jgi:uncharacterized protein with FMN-binding domain|nr:FMN-binding protein [Kitasatospora sp.]